MAVHNTIDVWMISQLRVSVAQSAAAISCPNVTARHWIAAGADTLDNHRCAAVVHVQAAVCYAALRLQQMN